MDTCVFTGYLTKDELRERHAKEFRRLFPHEPLHGDPPAAKEAQTLAPAQAPGAAPSEPSPAAEPEPQPPTARANLP